MPSLPSTSAINRLQETAQVAIIVVGWRCRRCQITIIVILIIIDGLYSVESEFRPAFSALWSGYQSYLWRGGSSQAGANKEGETQSWMGQSFGQSFWQSQGFSGPAQAGTDRTNAGAALSRFAPAPACHAETRISDSTFSRARRRETRLAILPIQIPEAR